MSWHKLIFKQNQPIHIGSGKWGVVNETDIFITGQTMWGALTNIYIQKNKVKKDELEITLKLFENISNFFPSFDEKNILAPHYKNGEFYLGELSENEFKAYFVDTSVHTAIEPMSRKAKDESLNEIDFILPQPKKEFQYHEKLRSIKENLYWIGVIYLNNSKIFLEKGLKIYVGADSRYGYGELELIEIENLEKNDKSFWWIESDENNFKIQQKQNSPYFIAFSNEIEFIGEYLLLTELDFFQNTPIVKEANFFINVGSEIVKRNDKVLTLKKGKLYYAHSS